MSLFAAWLLRAVIVPELAAAHVRPPVLPDWAVRTYPLVGLLLTYTLASSTISSAITVAPSAVDVTSPEWLGCT